MPDAGMSLDEGVRGVEPAASETVEVSGRFLDAVSPDRTALAGLIVYLAITAIAPVEPQVDVNLQALSYVALCYTAFLGGVALRRMHGSIDNLPTPLSIRPIGLPAYLFVLGVACLGVGLRVIDRFVVRQVELGDDFAAVREQLQSTQASLLSALSAALYPAAFAALITYYLLPARRRSALLAAAAYLVFLYPAFEAGVQGSRSLMLISFGFVLQSRQLILDAFGFLRRPLVFYGGSLVLLYCLFLIFQMRLEAAGLDIAASSQTSGYAFTVPPAAWAEDLMASGDPMVRLLASIAVHVTQYYCHSGYELMYIFDRLPDRPLFGAYNFFHLFKLVSLLTGDTAVVERVQSVDIRTGVFATFFVPLFVDFGWLGVPVMFGFGWVCAVLWLAARRRTAVWFPLHAYMTIVVFLMPVTTFIVAAQGLYTIVALSLIGIGISLIDGAAADGRARITAR
ncbi:MAG TPA: hypothetical protein VMB81_00180 [Candidatus Sulfotelmatobacter sp.]|nr:hypothetical protein [Candidatus Sulfotelmatobacter sp.]